MYESRDTLNTYRVNQTTWLINRYVIYFTNCERLITQSIDLLLSSTPGLLLSNQNATEIGVKNIS